MPNFTLHSTRNNVVCPIYLDTLHHKETRRFKKIDTLLHHAQKQKDLAKNRKAYRFWSLEISILIEQFTSRKMDIDTLTGMELREQSKSNIKRLKALKKSIQ